MEIIKRYTYINYQKDYQPIHKYEANKLNQNNDGNNNANEKKHTNTHTFKLCGNVTLSIVRYLISDHTNKHRHTHTQEHV